MEPWQTWGAPEHMKMFGCKVCGEICGSSPGYGQAVCPVHCEEHEFEYNRDLHGHYCRHCEEPAPHDWLED